MKEFRTPEGEILTQNTGTEKENPEGEILEHKHEKNKTPKGRS